MNQQTTIVGNLGKDPEMKFTPAGKATTSFSVATSHQYTQNGETVYASADGTVTLASTSNSSIGKVVQWISGTTCDVYFEGAIVRSI